MFCLVGLPAYSVVLKRVGSARPRGSPCVAELTRKLAGSQQPGHSCRRCAAIPGMVRVCQRSNSEGES